MVCESEEWYFWFFFFQAEDGIRDYKVTGVQTCALPISRPGGQRPGAGRRGPVAAGPACDRRAGNGGGRRARDRPGQIGRGAGRERGEISGVAGSLKKKKKT